jgi:hypothetical protein
MDLHPNLAITTQHLLLNSDGFEQSQAELVEHNLRRTSRAQGGSILTG